MRVTFSAELSATRAKPGSCSRKQISDHLSVCTGVDSSWAQRVPKLHQLSRPPGSCVPGGRVSPHVSKDRATCPLLWAVALGAAQPCGVSLTTRGIAPASLRYGRLALVASVAGPLCLAGDPLLECVRAHLSTVASMAPGDVCHGPGCSLAGLRPGALGYRPCCWPGGSAGSPKCARPMGCWFFPVPRPP